MPSNKVLESKKQIVDSLVDEFRQAQSIVFAEYRGLTVAQDTELRTALRKAGVTYQVVKNTLSSRALALTGVEGMTEQLTGPTAIAYSKTDLIAPAKVLKEYAGKYDKLKLKGGILEGRMIDQEAVMSLASIPGRDVLYGQLAFSLISPIAGLAFVLNAIRENMENGTAAAEPAAVQETAE